MPAHFSLSLLCAIFAGAAATVWVAGTHVSDATGVPGLFFVARHGI
jgi:hypothetical protein